MAAPVRTLSQTGPNPPLTCPTMRHFTSFTLLTSKLLLRAFLRKPGPIENKVIWRWFPHECQDRGPARVFANRSSRDERVRSILGIRDILATDLEKREVFRFILRIHRNENVNPTMYTRTPSSA